MKVPKKAENIFRTRGSGLGYAARDMYVETVWAAAAGTAFGLALGAALTRSRIGALEAELKFAAQSAERSLGEAAERERLAEAMQDRFKVLAEEILERKSRSFAENNTAQVGALVRPVQERLQEFKDSVERGRAAEGAERAALRSEIGRLYEMNRMLGHETQRLSAALRGSSKLRGDWGETVLLRIFETAGLTEGREYLLQNGETTEDGRMLRPDAVLLLPENRRIVIDAKVTLNGLWDLTEADDETARKAAVKRLTASLRTHMRSLAEKKYHTLPGMGEGSDFTIMFVPSEAAFLAAVGEDDDLLHEAWKSNVLPAGPSTLMFAVRSVAQVRRSETRARNVQRIAERGAALYDKLSEFLNDLQKVGEKLDQARDAFASARDRLTARRGNVLRQAQMLVELGVKPSKKITAFADVVEEEEHADEEEPA